MKDGSSMLPEATHLVYVPLAASVTVTAAPEDERVKSVVWAVVVHGRLPVPEGLMVPEFTVTVRAVVP